MRTLLIVLISVSFSFGQNIKDITNQVISTSDNDSIIVSEISSWIIDNIEFNTKIFKEDKIYSIDYITKNKLATPNGFALLFSKMLNIANIKNSTVDGYYKGVFYENGDAVLRANHIWNAVFINEEWHLFDLTLAKGIIVNPETTNANKHKLEFINKYNKYMLFADPTEFRKTHLPLQKYWQLSSKPITVDEFTKGIYIKNTSSKYDFISDIDKNTYRKRELNKMLATYDIAYKENNKNIMIVGLQNYKLAKQKYSKVERGSVSDELDYKKAIALVNRYNQQVVLKYNAHIRNVKQEYRRKTTNSKTFSTSNLKVINENIRIVKRDIIERDKIIVNFNNKNKLYNDLIGKYKSSIIESDNNINSNINIILEQDKLNDLYKKLDSISLILKSINTDAIKHNTNYIINIEDSISSLLLERIELENHKNTFIINFGWNNILVFEKINDSITSNRLKTNLQLNIINSNIDTSYFKNIGSIKVLVQNAENQYNLMTSEVVSDTIFSLFNKKMNMIYNDAQTIFTSNINALKVITTRLDGNYNEQNKELLSLLNMQLKSEKDRLVNVGNYYNELMNNEINIFNSAIEKCNIRITKPFNKYLKDGCQEFPIVEFIYFE